MNVSALFSLFFIVCLYGLVMLFVLFSLVLTAYDCTVIYFSNKQKHVQFWQEAGVFNSHLMEVIHSAFTIAPNLLCSSVFHTQVTEHTNTFGKTLQF